VEVRLTKDRIDERALTPLIIMRPPPANRKPHMRIKRDRGVIVLRHFEEHAGCAQTNGFIRTCVNKHARKSLAARGLRGAERQNLRFIGCDFTRMKACECLSLTAKPCECLWPPTAEEVPAHPRIVEAFPCRRAMSAASLVRQRECWRSWHDARKPGIGGRK
jgi:hypothetical protein